MSATRLQLFGAFAALAVATTDSLQARADQLVMREKPGHVTEASVTVDASPSAIYAFVTDYSNWTSVFSDVTSVEVKSGGRRDAKVRFRSKSLAHTVTVAFDNVTDQLISFRGIDGPPGGRATGSFVLTPVDGGRRTHVKGRLYMDVVGVPGLFVSDSEIVMMRVGKLRADMTDVMNAFPTRPEQR